MKLFKLLLAILIACIGLTLRPSGAPAQDDVVAGAKKEVQLVLYLSTNLTDANGMIQLFRQKYPFVKVDFFRADNEKLLNRIVTENTAGKFNGMSFSSAASRCACCCKESCCRSTSRRTDPGLDPGD